MPLRSFQHDGREWTVWDTRPDEQTEARSRLSVAEAYSDGWLTFQCDVEKRRLAPIPREWLELAEGQLASLLERAAPVRQAPDLRL